MGITHSKVSSKTDGNDSSLVRPSDWNAAHTGTMDLLFDIAASSAPSSHFVNRIAVTDGNAWVGKVGDSYFINHLYVSATLGGTTRAGGRHQLVLTADFNTPSDSGSAAYANRNYVNQALIWNVSSDDGGTAATLADSRGAFFNLNPVMNVTADGTSLAAAIQAEWDFCSDTGSSMAIKAHCAFVTGTPAPDLVSGSVLDASCYWSKSSGDIGWTYALRFGVDAALGTSTSFPVKSSGTIIFADTGSCAVGIDFSNVTFSTAAIKLSGTTGASPAPAISLGSYYDLAGNPSVSHIDLFGGAYGFGISAFALNYFADGGAAHNFYVTPSVPVCSIQANAVYAGVSTAIPAGGTAGFGFKWSSTANFGVFFGSGAPTLAAAQGSLYLRSDGTTTNDRAYINTDGSTTWTALTTAA